MATYHIDHRTVYRYNFEVAVSHHFGCMRPRDAANQRCHNFSLEINPDPEDLSERLDFFGNTVHQFSLQKMHKELELRTLSEVTVTPNECPMDSLTPTNNEVRKALADAVETRLIDVLQFTYPSPCIPDIDAIKEFAKPFFPEDANFLSCVKNLNERIYDKFEFDADATDVSTPVDEVLKIKRGVCQDFAHLMIACIRSMRLPARYVSGYILTQPPEGQERLEGADASHAWVSVFLPGYGWIDFDPTNNMICSDQHITVGYGRDYKDVSLLRGAMTGGGDHDIVIAVTVKPID